MLRQSLSTIALVATLFGAGCVTAPPPYNPFKVPEQGFRDRFKTVAMAPVAVPGDLAEPDPVKAKFASLVEAKLREAGFTVVSSKETLDLFQNMSKQLGGIFDPVTGKRDEAKFKAAREHTLRELGTKFKAEAVVYSTIFAGPARFGGGTAHWNGASESITMAQGFLASFQVNNLSGTTRALSLGVSIEDINGTDLYANAGGIQLAAKYSGGQFNAVPRDQLFLDEGRNAASVTVALEPLVKSLAGGAPQPPR